MNSKSAFKYALGLDIGIASVGWALLGEDRIIDLGVRCFDKAETADKGESLNLARRTSRLLRRRLRRRAWRLTKLSRLLKREGLIADVNILKQPPDKGFSTPNVWQLRVEALNRKLCAEEWARVIYHLCKHRGFHWLSKAEEKKADDDKEGGAVKKGLAGTKRLMQDKGYRSAAEMVINEFPDAQRNKRGDYSKALSRELLSNELKLLFECQRRFDNPYTSADFEQKLLDRKHGLLWAQKPSLSGEALLKMLGKCTFEKSEYRAPKASFTVERHVWLTRLNNCRLIIDGEKRELSAAERAVAIKLPYDQASDLTYKQLRKALIHAGLTNEFRFAGLVYPSTLQSEQEKAKDPEEEKLIKLTAWQQLRKAMKEADLEKDWQKIAVDALDGKATLYDEIARILSIYKEDERLESYVGRVRSGDIENMEGQAAAFYFPQLFGKGFKRMQESFTNAALDYGYAVIRGTIARGLVAHGIMPAMGIFHASEQNAFNLADDLIEPFRPLVDLCVKNMPLPANEVLTPLHKATLVNLLNIDVGMPRGTMSVLSAIEQLVESLARVLDGGSPEVLELPILIGLEQHQLEY